MNILKSFIYVIYSKFQTTEVILLQRFCFSEERSLLYAHVLMLESLDKMLFTIKELRILKKKTMFLYH